MATLKSTTERPATIYVLCDSREPDPVARVRYVGQTVRPLAIRLGRHVADAKHGEDTYRARWMRAVWRAGGDVLIEAVAIVPQSEWGGAEIRAIRTYRFLGYNLTNSTDGGDGMLNPSAVTRAKLSQAHRGNQHRLGQRASAETRAKMSASHKGCKRSPEAIARTVATRRLGKGYTHTPESIARMSASHRGKKFDPAMYASRRVMHSGAGNPAAKLTWDKVTAIRARRAAGASVRELASEYGVYRGTIHFIVTNQTWRAA